jgi:hypothetical protein
MHLKKMRKKLKKQLDKIEDMQMILDNEKDDLTSRQHDIDALHSDLEDVIIRIDNMD